MPEELYVYYKIAAADVDAALAVLRAWPDVRVLKRDSLADELQTWMEIHVGPDASETELALAAALQPHIAGRRHVERFVPLAVTAP